MSTFRIAVKGNEFGETYHTALAIITCTGNPTPVGPQWVPATNDEATAHLTTKDGQKTFLSKVALYVKLQKLLQKDKDSKIVFEKDEIDAVGVRGASDESLSSNAASAESAAALKKIRLIGDAELQAKKKLIRNIFLFNPVLNEKLPRQLGFDDKLRQKITQELNQRNIDTASEKVLVFNRQQAGSANRNLNKAMLTAIIKNTTANQFLINSAAAEEQAFNNLWASLPPAVRQGKTFVHLGKFIQGKQKKDETQDDIFNNTDAYTFQLNVLDVLHEEFKTTRAYGVKSGALDGPAFLGIQTLYCLGADDNDERVKFIGLYYLYGRLNVV